MNVADPPFREVVRGLLHERLLDAAGEITARDGWGSVTMAALAQQVGVSRQTVYNELGSKPEIAEALVLRELVRFLQAVRERLAAETDPVEGVRSAAEAALVLARESPVLRAVVTSAHVGSNDLVPLLTTEAEHLIDAASDAVTVMLGEQHGDLGLGVRGLTTLVDAVVRLVLSHVLQPRTDPTRTADEIAWLVGRVLGRPA